MPEELEPEFEIGQEIKEKGLPNSEGGEIIRILYNSDSGFRYVFASKEVDIAEKKVVHGQKVCTEQEVEEFDED